jgi:hypothetical protein
MITVTEEAKQLFLNVEHPEGTILRLDPVIDQDTGETQIGLAAGEPQASRRATTRSSSTTARASCTSPPP